MNYLFGDSSPSQLKSNFLEFLRDAMDFAVFVLQADERIKLGKAKIRALNEEAEAEQKRLDHFVGVVASSVDAAEKGKADSATAGCAVRIKELVAGAHRASTGGIRQQLADEIAKVDAEEAGTRGACASALATLLAPHYPPDAVIVVRVKLGEGGRYDASLSGKAELGLDWSFDLAVPDGSLWAHPLRVDRVLPQLEILAPALSGWISKEVKVRPQKLERYIVTELDDDGERLEIKLRPEPTADTGYDLRLQHDNAKLSMRRIGPEGDASVGPFDVQNEDAATLLDFAQKLRPTALDLERRHLTQATFDGEDFQAQFTFVDFVQKLVAWMTPIVREISSRSLTPNELVIRRALSNDRREEIFVAKATLREKYAVLPDALRQLFAPLGLDAGIPQSSPDVTKPKLPPPSPKADAHRAELPRSNPPPPVPRTPPPPPRKPANAVSDEIDIDVTESMTTPAASPSTSEGRSALRQSAPNITVPNAPPAPPSSAAKGLAGSENARATRPDGSDKAAPQPPPSSAAASSVAIGAGSSGVSAPNGPSSAKVPAAPDSSASLDGVPSSSRISRNETLAAVLKKIVTLSKNGRIDDAYAEYEALFASGAFAEFRPEDQRAALKLMVHGKTPPASAKEAAVSAHRAALERLKSLTSAHDEAGDFEMLGLAHLTLDDKPAATAAFEKGLALETAKAPGSDLASALSKRLEG